MEGVAEKKNEREALSYPGPGPHAPPMTPHTPGNPSRDETTIRDRFKILTYSKNKNVGKNESYPGMRTDEPVSVDFGQKLCSLL